MATHARGPVLIGDLHTAAIVDGGAVTWLCLPTFEGKSVFGSMRAGADGGTWSIDMDDARTEPIPYAAIAQSSGTVKSVPIDVRDFMVPKTGDDPATHVLVRRITASQQCMVRMRFDPRPNNGYERPSFVEESWGVRVRASDRELRLWLPAGAVIERVKNKEGLAIIIPVAANTPTDCILAYGDTTEPPRGKRDLEERTIAFWKNWVASGNFTFSRPGLVRSAINVKLLQFAPTGGIVSSAAGADRSVSLHDAAFALYAAYVLGFNDDAQSFFSYLRHISHDAKECDGGTCTLALPPSYTVWGQAIMPPGTTNVDFPCDVYGSLIDAYYFMQKRVPVMDVATRDIVHMLGQGLFQRAGSPLPNRTYDRVMLWLGLDRCLRMESALSLTPTTSAAWKRARDTVADAIWKECFDEQSCTFQQSTTSSTPDPAAPLYVLLQFLDRHQERTTRIIQAAEAALPPDADATHRLWLAAALAAIGDTANAERFLSAYEQTAGERGIDPSDQSIRSMPFIGHIMAAYYVHRYTSDKRAPIPQRTDMKM